VNFEAIDWAFDRPIANSADKLVLLVLARRANKHWAAFPGKAEIARRTGLAERSIPKCIKRLEDDGHLVRIAFAGISGQDQKIGYVLAGGGRLLDDLDDAFLALAFADRKQLGMSSAVKPQHWSGERKGEGRQPATRGGSPHSDPQGRQGATPRSKEHREDHKEREDTFGEARDKSLAINDPAIAEAPAPPAARTTESFDQEAPKIPAQRTYSSNRERDDDWRIQLAMADPDNLYEALNAYRDRLGALEDWAYRTAASDLGIDLDPKDEVPEDPDDDWTRAAYLYLLKRHDNDGDWDALFTLMEPLDPDTRAMPGRTSPSSGTCGRRCGTRAGSRPWSGCGPGSGR
jgi:biotin operon repressor